MGFIMGKVCQRHPELNGKRYESNKGCPLCNLETQRRLRKARTIGHKRGEKTIGAICPSHPDSHGLRYLNNGACVECTAERTAVLDEKRRVLLKKAKQMEELLREAVDLDDFISPGLRDRAKELLS